MLIVLQPRCRQKAILGAELDAHLEASAACLLDHGNSSRVFLRPRWWGRITFSVSSDGSENSSL